MQHTQTHQCNPYMPASFFLCWLCSCLCNIDLTAYIQLGLHLQSKRGVVPVFPRWIPPVQPSYTKDRGISATCHDCLRVCLPVPRHTDSESSPVCVGLGCGQRLLIWQRPPAPQPNSDALRVGHHLYHHLSSAHMRWKVLLS